jgi:hypothetical protein
MVPGSCWGASTSSTMYTINLMWAVVIHVIAIKVDMSSWSLLWLGVNIVGERCWCCSTCWRHIRWLVWRCVSLWWVLRTCLWVSVVWWRVVGQLQLKGWCLSGVICPILGPRPLSCLFPQVLINWPLIVRVVSVPCGPLMRWHIGSPPSIITPSFPCRVTCFPPLSRPPLIIHAWGGCVTTSRRRYRRRHSTTISSRPCWARDRSVITNTI